jgi:hypothetical protein
VSGQRTRGTDKITSRRDFQHDKKIGVGGFRKSIESAFHQLARPNRFLPLVGSWEGFRKRAPTPLLLLAKARHGGGIGTRTVAISDCYCLQSTSAPMVTYVPADVIAPRCALARALFHTRVFLTSSVGTSRIARACKSLSIGRLGEFFEARREHKTPLSDCSGPFVTKPGAL